MPEKEGGDSEKKMTKDFLDRWKKIATKYEGPEDSEEKKEVPKGTNGAPARTTEEDLDRFLANIDEKAAAKSPAQQDQRDLDDLLAEFGLEEGAEGTKAPKPAVKASPPPGPSAEESQKRVLETLKKVGLVGSGPAPPREVPKPAPPAPRAPPPPPPPAVDDEQEDSLMLELEALLSQEGPSPQEAAKAAPEAARPEAFEEEDLISELEGLLEGSNEVEEEEEPEFSLAPQAPAPPAVVMKPAAAPPAPPAPAPPAAVVKTAAPPPVKPQGIAPPPAVAPKVTPPVRITPAAIEPPKAAPPPVLSAAQSTRPGRVNGGRVNGGRVNGGRVNGGRVNGGRVNGGSVDAGRVNGGRVNGGTLDAGRVNGGRVNGGRVNGGRVNGGRVNGGRVNGGRVNGGRTMPRILVQENRRSRLIRIAVAAVIGVSLTAGLLSFGPFGGGPRGPTVDGDISDWAATGALTYSDVQDANIPSSLDLREYSIRAEGVPAGRLWFEAKTQSDFFSRPGAVPARGDLFVLLVDVDGSAATGYAYHDLGVDRIVEVTGWDAQVRSTATKAFGPRPNYDYAGFEPVGGLQVAVKGDRIEGLITGIQRIDPGARAAFELRGLDSNGVERTDLTPAPATLRDASVAALVTHVSPGILQPGSTTDTPMLSVRLWNPSPTAVSISSVRVTARYAPLAPSQSVSGSIWRDTNQNGVPEPGGDTKLSVTSSAMPQQIGTVLTIAPAISLAPGAGETLLVTIDNVPATMAAGSSVVLSIDAPTDIAASGNATVSLMRNPTPAGSQPGAYVASPPSAVAVDGITLDWASRPSVQDPAADVGNPSVDITQMAANTTALQLSLLVSLSSTPMAGALVPVRLPGTQVVVSTGQGSSAPPGIAPPNPGTDFVFVMIEADNDAGTGFLAGGKGYDFAIRVDGKGGQVLPGGAKMFRWEAGPTPGWTLLQPVPSVGLGPNAIELGAANPPFVLLARNVTLLAYASDWQGLRDDLQAPLIISNSVGTRGDLLPQSTHDPVDGSGEDGSPTIGVPEFQDIFVPAAGVLSIVGLSRRRRARAAEASKT